MNSLEVSRRFVRRTDTPERWQYLILCLHTTDFAHGNGDCVTMAARAAIKQRLTMAAMSESHIWSRLAAIEGLGKLGDPDSVALLRSLAASDSTPDPQGRPGRNLVREEANKALARKTP